MYVFGPNAAAQLLATCDQVSQKINEFNRLNQLYMLRILSTIDPGIKELIKDISVLANEYNDPSGEALNNNPKTQFEDMLSDVDLAFDVGVELAGANLETSQDHYNLTVGLFTRQLGTTQVQLTLDRKMLESLEHSDHLVALHKHQLFLYSLYTVINDTRRSFTIPNSPFPMPDEFIMDEKRYKMLVSTTELMLNDQTLIKCETAFPNEQNIEGDGES